MEEIKKLDDAEKILELPISYEEKGIVKGKEIGKELGKELGKEEGIKEVALSMLKEGVDITLIAKVTHLQRDEIKKLARTL